MVYEDFKDLTRRLSSDIMTIVTKHLISLKVLNIIDIKKAFA